MKHGYKSIKDSVRHYPLLLTSYPVKLQKEMDQLLPYSTGIEIEINTRSVYYSYISELLDQTGVLAYGFESEEFKFRIPNGIRGMMALYRVCEILREHFELNLKSGIHYHIDCSDLDNFSLFAEHSYESYLKDSRNFWALQSLKSWNYNGNYNPWKVTDSKEGVISFRSGLKTIEFRLGEMTFDYNLMLKRIIHAQNITKKFKNDYKKSLISL